MSIAIVPIKALSMGKSRLHPRLEREQLEALSLAMLEDIVGALRASPSVERIAIVTPDPDVADRAERIGAEALLLTDPGLNASLEAATQRFHADGQPSLIVLGDVAGATPQDIEAVHAALAAQGGGVAIAPSSDGGTSALLRDPPTAIGCHFGPDSAKAHRLAAEQAEVAWIELALPSLAIDLDHPADLDRFLASDTGGSRTRALLQAFATGREGEAK